MRILISNSSDKPIYDQIVDQMKSLILKGDLTEGEALPSIRNLAKELQISVITTKRSYEELENQGFIETVRGKGSFVAEENKELFKEKKLKMIEEKLEEAVTEANALGLTEEEVIDMVKILFEEFK
ncbi:MAG: GntR family transcriptional regulator [Clostridiaceae bacterium]